MVTLLVILTALVQAQDWNIVQNIPRDSQVKVKTVNGDVAGSVASVSADSIAVRTNSGERAIARTDVKQIKIRSHSRRIRNGVLGTAIGVGAGIGIGVAICPGCQGEGKPYKFIGPLVVIGGGLGAAVGFGPPAYQSIYKAP